MIKTDFRHKEIKPCEKTYYQEDYQWIGDGKKETVQDISSGRNLLLGRLFQFA